MLIPKQSDQLLITGTITSMETDSKDESDQNNDRPPETAPKIKVSTAHQKLDNILVNGTVNGEIKHPNTITPPTPTTTTKCMNILQNIIIKKEDHDHCIQIPIKREIDEDTLNNRIKVPKRDVSETSVPNTCTSIKQEVLDIKNEIPEAIINSSNTAEGENSSDSKTEVHTCFQCNMIFMEKNAFTIHSKRCGSEPNYASEPEEPQTSSTNSSSNHRSATTNIYLMHLEQLPRMIETIRNTPCLYNTDTEGYNNAELKDEMWSTIASDCNFANGKVAKGTWKIILQEFCDLLNRRRSGSLTEPYPYEQQLQFILPYINVKPTTTSTTNIIHNDSYTNNYPTHANFTTNEIIEEIDDAQSIIHVAAPTKIQQRVATPFINRQIEREPLQLPPLPTAFPTASNSGRALDLFFMSMCETAKGLPFHLQRQVKKKIFDSIQEAEEILSRVNHIRNESFSPPQSPDEDQFQY